MVLEPLFFELYFPWLAKEKIENAAASRVAKSKTKESLNVALLSKVLDKEGKTPNPTQKAFTVPDYKTSKSDSEPQAKSAANILDSLKQQLKENLDGHHNEYVKEI
jgi:hypothetical protein